MKMLVLIAAGAASVAIAAPAAAQYPYPQQPYPQTYPQPGYGYGQPGYGGQGAIGQIIDSLLGNRYNVTDRRAVSQCAAAATAQAQHQYRGGGYGAYGGGYGQGYSPYGQGIAAPMMRVTAITSVERRSNGLRVRGLLSSGYGGGYGAYGGGYGAQYGYQNQGYAAGDLGFRCNVDYRGVVTNVRITRNAGYRRY